MNATVQRRSNRPLTKYACDFLDDFLKGKLEPFQDCNENTTVRCDISKTSLAEISSFAVDLYRSEILQVIMKNEDPLSVKVSIGDHFTEEGYPKKTTIERLNGLLDELGCHGIIPEGVRIFKDRIEGLFYLGKGDNKIAVGKGLATQIILDPDQDEFLIQATDLYIGQ
jgi:hypothetical protein